MKERLTVRWFRKRALLYHLLLAIIVPGCLLAGWWQVTRAMQGNTLSYLYSIEWPAFAVLAVVGWWQLIHEDPAAVDARKVERARRAANRGPFVPPPPDADSGFFAPIGRGDAGAIGDGGVGRLSGASREMAAQSSELEVDPHTGRLVARYADEGPAADEDVHALSSYNAYLARLSAGGGRKSWRNPHGAPPRPARR